MTHLGFSTCLVAGVTLWLLMLRVNSAHLRCSKPDVNYRNFYIFGSHNKTGFWKTTLGNIKVAIEHAGKPQMKAMGTGYWEVSVKINSTVCGSFDNQESGAIEKELSSNEDNIFLDSDKYNYPLDGQGVESEYQQDRRTLRIRGDTESNNDKTQRLDYSIHQFTKLKEESRSSDDGFDDDTPSDDENDDEWDAEQMLSDDTNELPLRIATVKLDVEPEPTPGMLRMYPRPWVGRGWSSEYTNYGSAGVFKLFDDSLPWRLAKERCERDGAHLASLDSDAKVDVFLDLFSRNPRVPRTAVLKNQVYIGLNDQEEEGVFRTVTGKLFVPWNAKVWSDNEPDDAGGAEDCVTFHTTGRIRDVPCGFSLPFICELDQ